MLLLKTTAFTMELPISLTYVLNLEHITEKQNMEQNLRIGYYKYTSVRDLVIIIGC